MLFPNADESEGVSATNFGFMNESLDVPWPCIYWKKSNAIKGVCVRVLEHQSFMFREGQYSLHPCLQEDCVDNLLVILKQKTGYLYERGQFQKGVMAKILEREGRILSLTFHGQLPDYWLHAFSLTRPADELYSKEMRAWVAPRLHLIAYVYGVNQENQETRGA